MEVNKTTNTSTLYRTYNKIAVQGQHSRTVMQFQSPKYCNCGTHSMSFLTKTWHYRTGSKFRGYKISCFSEKFLIL